MRRLLPLPGRPLMRRSGAAAGALLAMACLTACGSGGSPHAGAASARATPPPVAASPPSATTTASPETALPGVAPPPSTPPGGAGPSADCSWARSEAEASQRARTALAGLTQPQRVAQLFVVGVPLTALAAGDALARQGVGGLVLAGRSALPVSAIAATTARWATEAPGVRPWVAVDQEGGKVQTLSGPGFGTLPSAQAQAALPATARSGVADRLGASLAQAGVSVDLAPVADAVPAGTEAANPPIGAYQRQYGSTPATAAVGAGTTVCGLAAHRVVATLKHFPGLGRVRVNTDLAPATDSVTGPDDPQVAAFGQLAATAAHPFVMVSLARYPLISPEVAAFAPEVVTGLLRGRLGVGGVVISDDLGAAKAVAGVGPGTRAVRFLSAGGTLVLVLPSADLPGMERAVLARAAADHAFAAQMDAAALVALTAKARAGLL